MIPFEITTFIVGHPILDAQHRMLYELCSELAAWHACVADRGDQPIRERLGKLVQLTLEHFSTEERILAEYGFPSRLAHKDAHFEHVSVLSRIVANGMHSGIDERLAEELANWLLSHLASDREYAAFLTGA